MDNQYDITPPPAPPVPWWRRLHAALSFRDALYALEPVERNRLVGSQVESMRPAQQAVLAFGAALLSLTALLERTGHAGSMGYPIELELLGAAVVGATALALPLLQRWPMRLLVLSLSIVLLGALLSLPLPHDATQLSIRTALFHLFPMAFLALTVRPLAALVLVAIVVALAYVRVSLHGIPSSGGAIYWLYTGATLVFGLLLREYRNRNAVETFRIRLQLWTQASTDELTGLANRSGWNRDAGRAYAEAAARGQPVCVAFFDIDLFKTVNDLHGHEGGDRVLAVLGEVLARQLTPGMHAARLGGEEFALLSVECELSRIQALARGVREEFRRQAQPYAATLSVGIAQRSPGESLSATLRRADMALYEAKQSGRDRMMVSAPLSDPAEAGLQTP